MGMQVSILYGQNWNAVLEIVLRDDLTPAGESDMHYSYPQVQARGHVANDFAPFEVRRYGRYWEVRDAAGQLVCLTVYRRGAAEVIRRLKLDEPPTEGITAPH